MYALMAHYYAQGKHITQYGGRVTVADCLAHAPLMADHIVLHTVNNKGDPIAVQHAYKAGGAWRVI